MAGGGVGEAALLETVIASEAAGYAAGAELLGTALPAGGIGALAGVGELAGLTGAGAGAAGAAGTGLSAGTGGLPAILQNTAALNPEVASTTQSALQAGSFAQPSAVTNAMQGTNFAQMLGAPGVELAGGTPQAAVQAAADAFAPAVDPNVAMSEALKADPSLTMGPTGAYPTPGTPNYNDLMAKAMRVGDPTMSGKGDDKDFLGKIGEAWSALPKAAQYGLGALGAIKGLNYLEGNKYGTPEREVYSGPLSKFKYDPSRYTPLSAVPNVYRPAYAGGGPVEAMSNANAVGANTGYPMADIDKGAYATPWQTPIPRNVVTNAADTNVNLNTGEMKLAGGGLSDLGGYADYARGGRMLKGPGDGMSDSIPATIAGKQPARLANDEFVVPADVVSHLGNGSSDAGAKQLYRMMDKVRAARTGKTAQAKQINPNKYLPA